MKPPMIFEIKGNSLDDGPGIRSVVFFKGCPLNCIWCHNPESKHAYAELTFNSKECIGCGICRSVCPTGAAGRDRTLCTGCFECTKVCPTKALSKVGEAVDSEEKFNQLVEKLLRDKPFYDVSGGGVTLSGGEPTLHTEWVGRLARTLKENGVRVLVETCGYFDFDKVQEYLLPYVKDIFVDIKIYDRELHRRYCGVDNDLILSNIRKLQATKETFGYSLLPRVPLVPNITDTKENLSAIADFMADCGITKTDLLPYNPTWYFKNQKLGIETAPEIRSLNSFQSVEHINNCKSIFRDKNIEC